MDLFVYTCSSHAYQRLQWLCDIVNFQRKFIENTLSDSLLAIVRKCKVNRYYNLALFFIDIFNQKKIHKNLFYLRNAVKFMQAVFKKYNLINSMRIRFIIFLWRIVIL